MNDISAQPAVAATRTEQGTRTRVSLYIAFVLIAIAAAAYYRLRTDSIFACTANGYSSQQYLTYCQAAGYGDFDHGAFYFNLEPEATHAAATAEVLFVGNSRMSYGFSTTAAQDWLSKNVPSYFLLGFAYHPRVMFHRALLDRVKPQPKIYVINLDTFFQENASVPALTVMQQAGAPARYHEKQIWQAIHRIVCGPLPILCGHSETLFRNRQTGVWHSYGLPSANEAASVDEKIDDKEVAGEIALGRAFLDKLAVDPRCVIFTLVPTVDAPKPSSAAIAAALHVDLISPDLEDLLTFDGSHLDRVSAERWSGAFFEAASERIRECVSGSAAPVARQQAQ